VAGPMLPAALALLVLFSETGLVSSAVNRIARPLPSTTTSLSDTSTSSSAQPTQLSAAPRPPSSALRDRNASLPVDTSGRWEVVIDPADLFPGASSPYRAPAGGRSISEPPALWEMPLTLTSRVGQRAPRLESSDSDPNAYRVKPGDLLDIFVWGQENISGRSRVGRDGSVVVKLAGSIRLADLTVDDAARRIESKLSRFLIAPAVTVAVAEPGGKDVLVVGEVDGPGSFSIDRPTRVLDILILAKWNRENADLSNVTIARGDSTVSCDIAAVLRGVRISENRLLEPGDLVIVPGRGQTLSLLGAVMKPGRFTFASNRSVRIRDLLLEAGMWATNADIARAFILRADGTIDPCNVNALWFQGDAREDKSLRTGDALVFPELSEVGVYVLGSVGAPGLHTRRGAFNLLQALTMANPRIGEARLYDVRVVRGWPASPVVYKLNVKALLEGDLRGNMLLKPGDVIYVPRTLISSTLQFWNDLLSPIAGSASTIDNLSDLSNSNTR
jgi:polysaccharide export outer membrane protein